MTSTALIPCSRLEIQGLTYILVARFKEHAYEYDDPEGQPNAKIWIVQAGAVAQAETGKSWCIWIEPAFYEAKRQYNSPILSWIAGFDRRRSKLGFCEGRPMTELTITIPMCLAVDLPRILVGPSILPWVHSFLFGAFNCSIFSEKIFLKGGGAVLEVSLLCEPETLLSTFPFLSFFLSFLSFQHTLVFLLFQGLSKTNGKEPNIKIQYRVVHSEHPWGGVRARGYDKIATNPLTFQMHFQRHLKWSCRDLSPFMSTTDSLAKARRICAVYAHRGFTGIELLVIRTSDAASWRDTRVFHVRTLIERFDLPVLRRRQYFDNEWLVETEIPPGRYTRVPLYHVRSQCSGRSWEDHCREARLESERNGARKRRRLLLLADEDVGGPRKKKSSAWRTRTTKYAKVDH